VQRTEIRDLIKRQPFEPITFTLSDGRRVHVRHPDQVGVTNRNIFFGLAKVKGRMTNLETPDEDGYGKDFLLVDLMHVVSAELANEN